MPNYLSNNGTISMSSIANTFGPSNGITSVGNNLGVYVGYQWYTITSQTGIFTTPISFSNFYGKGPITPVTPGGYRYYMEHPGYQLWLQYFPHLPFPYPPHWLPEIPLPANFTSIAVSSTIGVFTVPEYTFLTINLYGSGGGGGGGQGNGGHGGTGGTGGRTTFGSPGQSWYASAAGGSGGDGYSNNGAPGYGSLGFPLGGAGSGPNVSWGSASAGGTGGAGGHTKIIVSNPAYNLGGKLGPAVGSNVNWSIGVQAAGGAGSSSGGLLWNTAPGAPGYYGWVDIGWS